MSISIGTDASAFQGFMGYVQGLSTQVNSDRYLNGVMEFTHAELTYHLDLHIDAVAKNHPRNLHHVYEWPRYWAPASKSPTIGDPTQRLWTHTLVGRGKNKVASVRFLASKVPTPVNPDLISDDEGKSVKTGVHIFHWKAPVMEAGMEITVTAQLAKYLAFVARSRSAGGGSSDAQVQRDSNGPTGILFAKSVHFTAGGGATTNMFENVYLSWWAMAASQIFDEKVAPILARDLIDEKELAGIARLKRPTKRIMNMAASSRDFNTGFERARQHMQQTGNRYIQQAAARRRLKYGY